MATVVSKRYDSAMGKMEPGRVYALEDLQRCKINDWLKDQKD